MQAEVKSCVKILVPWAKKAQNGGEKVGVFSEREVTHIHVHYVLSPVHLFVCCLSVTLVRPTQAVEIFRNISTTLGTLAIH